jgi:DNA-binding MarR family transcriptional regulator
MTPLLPEMDLAGTGYCAAFRFRMAARAVTRLFDAGLQKCGIRSTQFALLVAIAKKQPVAIHALSEILFIDATTLTRNLEVMRKEGFLLISPRATMRQRFVTLTPKGEHALARSLPFWRKIQNRFVQNVGTKHWTELRDELEQLSGLAVKLEEAEKPKKVGGAKRS